MIEEEIKEEDGKRRKRSKKKNKSTYEVVVRFCSVVL
jgi:hypothetical protein